MGCSRRLFIKSSGIAAIGVGLSRMPGFLVRAASDAPRRRSLRAVEHRPNRGEGPSDKIPLEFRASAGARLMRLSGELALSDGIDERSIQSRCDDALLAEIFRGVV